MKSTKKIFLSALVAALFLSACNSSPQTEVKLDSQPVAERQPLAVAESETGEVDIYVSRYGKNMNCNVLKDEEAKKMCDMQINDMIGNMLESEIVSAYDVARCSELPTEMATRCQERLNETGVKGPVSAEEIALFNEITRGTMSGEDENVVMVYDSARCAELKASGYKAYCERRTAERKDQEKFSEIMRSNNKNRCGELTSESMKMECKMIFGEEIPAPIVEVPVVEAPVMEETVTEDFEVNTEEN